jgi:uncharacterized phage protein (predicted DNA packaging)
MIIEVTEMKEYLRAESDEEDNFIENLIQAAELYLLNAGCILKGPNEQTTKLAKLAVKMLVSHWYENRQIEQTGTVVTKISFSLDSIIAQLKYCYGGEVQ